MTISFNINARRQVMCTSVGESRQRCWWLNINILAHNDSKDVRKNPWDRHLDMASWKFEENSAKLRGFVCRPPQEPL